MKRKDLERTLAFFILAWRACGTVFFLSTTLKAMVLAGKQTLSYLHLSCFNMDCLSYTAYVCMYIRAEIRPWILMCTLLAS
ncbi:hypothetical protein DM02DRAFT_86566 [Periconia macrospinosa]|uniref:Uncharacterized protein n=1 Tax=Periconia macrospinosa TaxID=97972 RepID=A0A2V1DJ36_9PLEO|nr:hypothetical protein DM02DRAFT_86566 [Periconia macrospinosa]